MDEKVTLNEPLDWIVRNWTRGESGLDQTIRMGSCRDLFAEIMFDIYCRLISPVNSALKFKNSLVKLKEFLHN